MDHANYNYDGHCIIYPLHGLHKVELTRSSLHEIINRIITVLIHSLKNYTFFSYAVKNTRKKLM